MTSQIEIARKLGGDIATQRLFVCDAAIAYHESILEYHKFPSRDRRMEMDGAAIRLRKNTGRLIELNAAWEDLSAHEIEDFGGDL